MKYPWIGNLSNLFTKIMIPLLFVTPLIVSTDTIYPHVVGKVIYSRTLIEIIFSIWLITLIKNRSYRPKLDWVLLILVLYILSGVLSSIFGVNFMQSFWADHVRMQGVWDDIHWVGLIVIIASLVKDESSWKYLFHSNLIVATIVSLISVMQAFGVSFLPAIYPNCSIDSSLGNPSYIASYLMVNIILVSGLLIQSFLNAEKAIDDTPIGILNPFQYFTKIRSLYFLALIIFSWVFFLAASRGALIALTTGFSLTILVLVISRGLISAKPIIIGFSSLMSLLVVFFAFDIEVGLPHAESCQTYCDHSIDLECVTSLPESFSDGLGLSFASTPQDSLNTALKDNDPTTNVLGPRYLIWKIAVSGFREKPILGWGPENFGRVFDRYAPYSSYEYDNLNADNAHNKLLNQLVERGGLGILIYLSMWLALLIGLYRAKVDYSQEVVKFTIFMALVAFFVQSIFLFDTPTNNLQLVMLASWVISWYWNNKKESVKVNSDIRAPGFGRLLSYWDYSHERISRVFPFIITVVICLTIFSLYSTAYNPYWSADSYLDSKNSYNVEDRISKARESHDLFPQNSLNARIVTLQDLSILWPDLSIQEQAVVMSYIEDQKIVSKSTWPGNVILLQAVYAIPQIASTSQIELDTVAPAIEKMFEIAPYRATTHHFLATQLALQGEYEEAIMVARNFVAQSPQTFKYFSPIVEYSTIMISASNSSQ